MSNAEKILTYTILDMESSAVQKYQSTEEVIKYIKLCVEEGADLSNIYIVETSNILQLKLLILSEENKHD